MYKILKFFEFLKNVGFFSFSFFLLININLIFSATPISNCQDIVFPGNYYLTNDLIAVGDCIILNTGNISFDCSGYSLIGDGSGTGLNMNSKNNISNCNILNFSKGIYFSYNDNNTFQNISLINNDYGLYMYRNSNYNNVTYFNFSDNYLYDIYIRRCDYCSNSYNYFYDGYSYHNFFEDIPNYFNNVTDLTYLDNKSNTLFNSDIKYYLNNNISNSLNLLNNVSLNCQGYSITGDGTGTGIYVGDYSNVTNCKIYNFSIGMYLDDYNYFNNITIQYNTNKGISMYGGNYNYFYNIISENNTNWDIYNICDYNHRNYYYDSEIGYLYDDSKSEYYNVSDITNIVKSHTFFNNKTYILSDNVERLIFKNSESKLNLNGYDLLGNPTLDYGLIFYFDKFNSSYIGLDGLEINNYKSGIKVFEISGGSSISNFKINNISNLAIYFQGSGNILVENITINNSMYGMRFGNGFTGNYFENNYFQNIDEYSILTYSNADNNIFKNNTFKDKLLNIEIPVGSDNNKFYLNKFYGFNTSIQNFGNNNLFSIDNGSGIYIGNYWSDPNSCLNSSDNETVGFEGINYVVCRSNNYSLINSIDYGVILATLPILNLEKINYIYPTPSNNLKKQNPYNLTINVSSLEARSLYVEFNNSIYPLIDNGDNTYSYNIFLNVTKNSEFKFTVFENDTGIKNYIQTRTIEIFLLSNSEGGNLPLFNIFSIFIFLFIFLILN